MGFLEDQDLKKVPTIPEFYRGKTIFITGGSGFIGQTIIEKLLYSCGDLARIYVLMRQKKKVDPEERLEALYKSGCFDRLRNERPGLFKSKVMALGGDISEIGLGLSEQDRDIIKNEVDIVFHIAASVRFDDTLKYAAIMNLRGTRELIKLAEDIKNLIAFIHVSTSYSNSNHDVIDEVMYPPHADWRETLDICDTIDDHTLNILTTKYISEMPNTYVFTKQLAEHLVYEQKGRLPIVIVRPSIVMSSVSEPVPGWINNFNGPIGLFVAVGKGILYSALTSPDIISDYMSVDFAARHLITTSWIRGTKKFSETDDIPIYHCCSGSLISVTMGEIMNDGFTKLDRYPFETMLWRPHLSFTTSKFVHFTMVYIFQVLPAILFDGLLRIAGKKPLLVKIQRRILTASLALYYYSTKQWTFKNDNFVRLRTCIKKEDREQFYYDPENVDKQEFMINNICGVKRHLLNEKEENLPQARINFKRMKRLDQLVKLIFLTGIVYWIYGKYSTVIYNELYNY